MEVDPLESLEGAFQGLFLHILTNVATFLLIEYIASIICQLVTHGDLDPIELL